MINKFFKGFYLACLLFFYLAGTMAQNRPDFFKTLPAPGAEMPAWAEKMYAADPNVYQVDEAYDQFYRSNPFIKNLHTQNYKYWRWRIGEIIDPEGFIRPKSFAEEKRSEQLLLQRLKERETPGDQRSSNTEWNCIGPFETYFSDGSEPVSWHKNVYAIDQSESDPDILICGTEAGGIYRTVNRGQDWFLISKNEVFSGGNEAVKIHPTDPDFLLVASNNRIYRSLDGGADWEEIYYMNGSGYEFKFNPSNPNIIFCVGSQGLFKSLDAGDSWSQIFSSKCWDIDFHPTNPSIIYLLKSNASLKRSELYRSDNGGTSWTLKDNGYYVASDLANASESGAKIAVTPAAPDYVYVCLIGASKANDNGWIGVYKSTNKGDSWINPAGQDGGPYGPINGSDPWNVAAYSDGYHQGFFNFDLEVSDSDPNRLWIATIRLTESADGGATFMSIGAANSNRLTNIHADVQDLEVNGNDIWVASDGGINYSTDELMSHDSRKKGIQASHFWGFNTGWNQDSYTGGRYHDGTIGWYENYPNGTVFNIGGVEEPSGYIHPVESRKMFFRTHYASSNTSVKTIPDEISGLTRSHASLPVYPNESYYTSASSGVYFDPRYADHLFVGHNNIIYKSVNGGLSFDTLFTFPAGMVYEVEQSRQDYQVFYAVFKPDGTSARNIYRSTDGGIHFTQVTNPPGNRNKIEISLNPQDADEIWIGLGDGANGSKVYRSTNGGNNWVNKTESGLDGESIQDIRFQGGTEGLIYLATYNGVFYLEPGGTEWTDYSLGLPLIAKSLKINPFYRDAELRLGTKGRGVFGRKLVDTLFIPVAQPITYRDTVFCRMDTVQFDCYSIIKQDGAQWAWTFDPQPEFVDNDHLRNPRVVFGATGNYAVTLSITDGQGQTDSRILPDMIIVEDRCGVDTLPGKSIHMESNGDYAQVSDLNLTGVDTLSITAWVKPNGIQNDYTGIVMNDNTAAGFNFANGNNTLRYHWPGGQWWWNSGLIVEQGVWSHVAMVATPAGMRLYVNGKESVHTIALNPVDINSFKIGSYQGWSGRNMNGEVDEVAIWTRALSQDEIRDFRHLTKEDTLDDPYFLAYYQFNETPGDPVFDKTGNGYDAALLNGAERVKSTAPVGGGKSQRMIVNGPGWHIFDQVGFHLPTDGSYPDGDLVVSRLNVVPDQIPTGSGYRPMYDDYYWIVNNYGQNQSFSMADSLWLYNLNFIYEGGDSKYSLWRRSENASGIAWNFLASSALKIGGVNSALLFTSGNGLDQGGQFIPAFKRNVEDIIWNGHRWRGGSGPLESPGAADQDKNVYIMPGQPAILLENAMCKDLFLFETGRFEIPEGLQLNVAN